MDFCYKHYRGIKSGETTCEICRLCPSKYYFDEENPEMQCNQLPGHTGKHSGGGRCFSWTWSDDDMIKDVS